MRPEGWFRLGYRALLMLAASPLIPLGYFVYGPAFLVFFFGVPIAIFICGRALIRRRMEGAPSLVVLAETKLDRARAAIHGARRRRRVRRVEAAASRMGEVDELLSPEGVRTGAEALFRLVHQAWRERDDGRLAALLGPELLAESEERLSRVFGGVPGDLVGDVDIEYVGFTTGTDPRAVVLVEAVLRDERRAGEPRLLCQYWTVADREGLWTVLDIEDRGEGRYHLVEPIGGASMALAAG